MRDRQPTMRSRELGEGLRRAMEAAGLTGVDAARRLDWSPSRVSRMLSGTRGTTDVDVAMFLTVCGVRGRERRGGGDGADAVTTSTLVVMVNLATERKTNPHCGVRRPR